MIGSTHPRARFGIRFSILARRWRQGVEAHLSTMGLTDASWMPLIHLHESGGGITQKALASLIGIDQSSLVRLLDILCQQELVERRQDENDGRARLVHLTPKGLARVTEIRAHLMRAEADMLAGVSDDELAAMLDHFDTIDQGLLASKQAREAAAKKPAL